MTIDRTARDQMAELLRHFVTGSVTNFSFEDNIPSSEDPIIWAIGQSMWYFYSDCEEHVLAYDRELPKEWKKEIARWIMFLYSDEGYKWPYPSVSGQGVLPLTPPNMLFSIFSKLLGEPAKEKKFMSYGNYDVWPFIDEESFNNAKKNPKLLNAK